MLDVLLPAIAVAISLAASYALVRLARQRPIETRGMLGLLATVVHLMLCLVLPAVAWMVHNPSRPLVFVASVLVFYWTSLIILVVTIIRWLRGTGAQVSAAPGNDSRHTL